MSSRQISPVTTGFEALKLTNGYNAEYLSARELQPLLGYSQWRRFEQAIERATASCEASGNKAQHHFAGAGKPITGGKGVVQLVDDEELSDQAVADVERIELRKQAAEEFKALSGAAQDAGVQSKMFGVFHDAGFRYYELAPTLLTTHRWGNLVINPAYDAATLAAAMCSIRNGRIVARNGARSLESVANPGTTRRLVGPTGGAV